MTSMHNWWIFSSFGSLDVASGTKEACLQGEDFRSDLANGCLCTFIVSSAIGLIFHLWKTTKDSDNSP